MVPNAESTDGATTPELVKSPAREPLPLMLPFKSIVVPLIAVSVVPPRRQSAALAVFAPPMESDFTVRFTAGPVTVSAFSETMKTSYGLVGSTRSDQFAPVPQLPLPALRQYIVGRFEFRWRYRFC